MATLFQLPKTAPVFGGDSLSGCKLYFFQSGTLTPIVTYTTAALSVAHAHPVVADGDGVFPAIFLNESVNTTYRMQLKDSTDVLQYDVDNLQGHAAPIVSQAQTVTAAWSFSATLTATGGASNASTSFLASSDYPSYGLYRVAAPTDEKVWEITGGVTGSFQVNALEDDYGFGNLLLIANRTGTSIDDVSLYTGASVQVFKLDTNNTAGNTRMFVYDVDNATLERVSVGAADSGGAGYKVLRIAN